MNSKQWANAIVCLTALMIFAYGVSRIAAAPDIAALLSPEVAVSKMAAARADTVILDGFELTVNQVTKRTKAVFRLTNKTKASVRDISILCDFYDDSGTSWGRGRWDIYDTLPAGRSETFVRADRRFISYHVRPEQSRCTIVNVHSLQKAAVSGEAVH